MATMVRIAVNGLAGPRCTVEASTEWTILQVKEAIFEKIGVPVEQQTLVKDSERLPSEASVGSLLSGEGANVLELMLVVQEALPSSEVPFPPEWTLISKHNADKPGAVYIEVEVGTQEYKEVEQRLRDVVGPKGVSQRNTFTNKVVKVERVENPMAFRAYDSRRRVLQKTARNNGNANELWVKHSTGKTNPKIICEGEEGLDYRYSGWGMFGRAAYTAEDANYLDNAYYRHEIALADGTMQRQMLLCQVAAGTIAEETYDANTTPNLIKPPPGFDSVRGDVVPGTGQFAIMVYSIDQAYPAYLITYEP